MKGIIRVILIALLATNVWCVPEGRLKRNHNAGRNYGHESGERDTSIEDGAPCGLLQDNSPEHGYDFDEYPNHGNRRISVNAAASAASSSYR